MIVIEPRVLSQMFILAYMISNTMLIWQGKVRHEKKRDYNKGQEAYEKFIVEHINLHDSEVITEDWDELYDNFLYKCTPPEVLYICSKILSKLLDKYYMDTSVKGLLKIISAKSKLFKKIPKNFDYDKFELSLHRITGKKLHFNFV